MNKGLQAVPAAFRSSVIPCRCTSTIPGDRFSDDRIRGTGKQGPGFEAAPDPLREGPCYAPGGSKVLMRMGMVPTTGRGRSSHL